MKLQICQRMMGIATTTAVTRQVLNFIINASDTAVVITSIPRERTGMRIKSTSGVQNK